MNINNKKTFYIVIFITILVIIAVIVTIFTRPKSVQQVSNPDQEAVFLPAMISDSQIYYFSKDTDSIKLWDLKTNKTQVVVKLPFQNTNQINYSPDLGQALVHWQNPQNAVDASTWLVDLKNRRVVKELSPYFYNIGWSPDSKEIAYQYTDNSGTNNISVADPDGSNPKILTNVTDDNVAVAWLDNNNLIFYTIPYEAAVVDLGSVNLETKKNATIDSNAFIGNTKQLIGQPLTLIDYTKKENASFNLAILDATTKKLSTLNTLVTTDKAGQLDGQKILYGAYRNSNASSDSLQKIDLGSGQIQDLKFKTSANLDIRNIMPTGKELYFTSDNQLYKLAIN
jgi:Tol biopolymer transport system component